MNRSGLFCFGSLEGLSHRFWNHSRHREHTIPLTAVATLDGDKLAEQVASVWVYQADSQTVTQRAVTLGVITGNMIEIKAGLNNGEMIIANGVNRLTEGQQVELKKG